MVSKVDYEEYLESDAWKEKRAKIRRRARGWCERCKVAKREDIHHLTYAHLGDERLDELVGVCHACHEFLHGRRVKDPAATTYTKEEIEALREWERLREFTSSEEAMSLLSKQYPRIFFMVCKCRQS